MEIDIPEDPPNSPQNDVHRPSPATIPEQMNEDDGELFWPL